MTTEPLLTGITSSFVSTARINTHVLTSGSADGVPVVLVHGNVSSNRFFEETMLALPNTFRVIAPDLCGYGQSDPERSRRAIDATRGLREWSDDLKALADALGLKKFHLVGWSLGGNVAMQYAIDRAADLLSLTLIAPGSPYGFGGTKDVAGTPNYPDFAGSGGGTANLDFVKRLSEGDRSTDSPSSPRNVMNTYYFKPPFKVSPEREEVFVSAMCATRVGDGFYPGDVTPSPNWPTIAPGTKGNNNTISPKYCDQSGLAHIDPKPPVLWVRGHGDQIVSDTSLFDFGVFGQREKGWPGVEVYPPQPMVSQIRAVLEKYQANGGRYTEQEIDNCGHAPHIEYRQKFVAMLLKHLRDA